VAAGLQVLLIKGMSFALNSRIAFVVAVLQATTMSLQFFLKQVGIFHTQGDDLFF
jgi:hypothetical protein